MQVRFPRQARLRKRADFERVYKQGRRHFGSYITAFYLASEGAGMRVGFTVGRTLGGAVQRNRIKRRLREAVRLHWPETPLRMDVVIHAKRSAIDADFALLGREVERAFDAIRKPPPSLVKVK